MNIKGLNDESTRVLQKFCLEEGKLHLSNGYGVINDLNGHAMRLYYKDSKGWTSKIIAGKFTVPGSKRTWKASGKIPHAWGEGYAVQEYDLATGELFEVRYALMAINRWADDYVQVEKVFLRRKSSDDILAMYGHTIYYSCLSINSVPWKTDKTVTELVDRIMLGNRPIAIDQIQSFTYVSHVTTPNDIKWNNVYTFCRSAENEDAFLMKYTSLEEKFGYYRLTKKEECYILQLITQYKTIKILPSSGTSSEIIVKLKNGDRISWKGEQTGIWEKNREIGDMFNSLCENRNSLYVI